MIAGRGFRSDIEVVEADEPSITSFHARYIRLTFADTTETRKKEKQKVKEKVKIYFVSYFLLIPLYMLNPLTSFIDWLLASHMIRNKHALFIEVRYYLHILPSGKKYNGSKVLFTAKLALLRMMQIKFMHMWESNMQSTLDISIYFPVGLKDGTLFWEKSIMILMRFFYLQKLFNLSMNNE